MVSQSKPEVLSLMFSDEPGKLDLYLTYNTLVNDLFTIKQAVTAAFKHFIKDVLLKSGIKFDYCNIFQYNTFLEGLLWIS